jgi:hypothetical protein
VLRDLQFDLTWKTTTRIQRLTDMGQGLTVRVPLLKGERPLNPDVQVKDGVALLPLPQNQSEAEFESALDTTESITLTAPPLSERAEIWTLQASPTWHVETKGVPQSLYGMEPSTADVQLRFDPLPGESLQIDLTRPVAAAGDAYRIDSVSVNVSPGEKLRGTELTFLLRATQGGSHTISLPKGAELISVSRDGQMQTLRLREGNLELPVHPGENAYIINLRETLNVAAGMAIPRIDLKLPAANVQMNLEVPHKRWLLWTAGPTLGPAILFWPQLLVILLIAGALAYSRRTALGPGSWALLGLGLAGLGWPAFAIVAVWFLLLQYRLQVGKSLLDWQHRTLQVALAGISLVAIAIIVSGAMNGLVSNLDMQVAGNDSTARNLRWFADLSTGVLPQASAVSVPSWVYKLLMLAWAMWLAFALLRWLRYAWTALNADGLWRQFPERRQPVVTDFSSSVAPTPAPTSAPETVTTVDAPEIPAPPPLPPRQTK